MKYISLLLLFYLFLPALPGSYAAPAEAEYGKYQETWTLQADGSQEHRCYQELTLFTHTAMNSTYGETFIVYNPRHQQLIIHSSYTRQKDGTIVRTPANAFVEVLPSKAEKASAYNHLREMVIVHTGLELGATIVLDYSVISSPGYLPGIDICQTLQKSSPIKEYTLTFDLPTGTPVYYKQQGITTQPAQYKTANRQQYQWKLRNLPALSREPETTIRDGQLPALSFNTFTSSAGALQILARQFDSPSAFTGLAGEITRDCRTSAERIQAIHAYVMNHIDNCPLNLATTGNTIRPAAAVLQSAYGTEAEKTNLLTALLNAAGIHATAAAAYEMNGTQEHCGLTGIRKFAVLTEADGQHYRLDVNSYQPVSRNYSFLLNIPDAALLLPDTLPGKIRYQAEIRWKKASQPEATVSATFSNGFISYNPEFTGELIQLSSKPEINRQPDCITLSGNTPVNIATRENYFLLTLPETHQGINRQSNYARWNSKRRHPLVLPARTDESYSWSVELPDTLTLCTPLQTKRIHNKAGELFLSVSREGQLVQVQHSLQLRKTKITPSEYADFRELMTEWDNIKRQPLLLKREKSL